MGNVKEYKGYHTKVLYDSKNNLLYGKIEGINDLVDFYSDSLDNVEKEFENAVDDYLEMCKELGKEPDKEFKGVFNVRISPSLHKKLYNKALKNDLTMNAAVEIAINEYCNEEKKETNDEE